MSGKRKMGVESDVIKGVQSLSYEHKCGNTYLMLIGSNPCPATGVGNNEPYFVNPQKKKILLHIFKASHTNFLFKF